MTGLQTLALALGGLSIGAVLGLWFGVRIGRTVEHYAAQKSRLAAYQSTVHVCDDCGMATFAWVDKSDHHGGTKRVCADRRPCNDRSPG